nr:unnamed protein product [Naegleria fowleri]
MKILRRLVSKKKKRYEDPENGFDLDLAYITPNIIAMGYPSPDFEKIYRNPMSEVQRFLETRHKDKYKLWNLCAERTYDKSCFHGRVEDRYQFYDHEAPKFEILIPFCKSVHEWLSQDPGNVAVIHCKAGKGRTGVCISCYLYYSQFLPTAKECLDYYARARTKNHKGVTIPSQRRYVYYLEKACLENASRAKRSIGIVETTSSDSIQSNNEDSVAASSLKKTHSGGLSRANESTSTISELTTTEKKDPPIPTSLSFISIFAQLSDSDILFPNSNPSLILQSLTLSPAPVIAGYINMEILDSNFNVLYDHKSKERNGITYKTTDSSVQFKCNVPVNGDFKIVVKKKKRGKFVKFFHFWINTHFVEQDADLYSVTLEKCDLDKIYRDTKHKKLPEGCKIIATFSRASTE